LTPEIVRFAPPPPRAQSSHECAAAPAGAGIQARHDYTLHSLFSWHSPAMQQQRHTKRSKGHATLALTRSGFEARLCAARILCSGAPQCSARIAAVFRVRTRSAVSSDIADDMPRGGVSALGE